MIGVWISPSQASRILFNRLCPRLPGQCLPFAVPGPCSSCLMPKNISEQVFLLFKYCGVAFSNIKNGRRRISGYYEFKLLKGIYPGPLTTPLHRTKKTIFKKCARSLWGARGDHKAFRPPKTHRLQSEVAIVLLLASRGTIQL